MSSCEVNSLGAALANIEDINTLLAQTVHQRRLDRLGSQANVMPDNDLYLD
jgi:hypothetical protein